MTRGSALKQEDDALGLGGIVRELRRERRDCGRGPVVAQHRRQGDAPEPDAAVAEKPAPCQVAALFLEEFGRVCHGQGN